MLLAYDKDSVRTKCVDGRLHVAVSNISKATVDPYYGEEIPDFEKLGLEARRLYYLLRDPEELKKGAATFNNLPILSEHVPVNAEDHQGDIVIGSTGTDAHMEGVYLCNSAVVWVQDAINDIDSEEKKEWSSAYHYRADMTSGVYNGLRFDGIMRDITGNHVALVERGRAGRDVVVGDSEPGTFYMLKSRRALMLSGAVTAALAPRLAMDSKLDFSTAFRGMTAKNVEKTKGTAAARVVKLARGKLAQDGELDVSDVIEIIDAMQGTAPDAVDDDVIMDEKPEKPALDEGDGEGEGDKPDSDTVAKIMDFLKGKLSDADMADLGKMVTGDVAEDEEADPPKEDGAPKDAKPKPAMDAASIRKGAMADFQAIRTAERKVEPLVGTLVIAMDSAADVYKFALDHLKVDTKGVHPSAYGAMVDMAITSRASTPRIAMDADARSAAQKEFDAMAPKAVKLQGVM